MADDMSSRPPSPGDRYASPRPGMSRSNSMTSFLSLDRYGEEWQTSAMTLFDVAETFFDSRLDLFNRRLKAQSARLRTRAVELIPKGLRTPKFGASTYQDDEDEGGQERTGDSARRRGESYKKDVEREVDRIKVKLAAKVTHLSSSWRSAQIVRTREKVSFLFGVMTLTFSCLLYGMAPEWLPFAYTAQMAFYLPSRVWIYKRKQFHYFLFDMCYFVNVLDLLWIWVFPSSSILFICCYLLTLGPLASAIITWRNSLVFHSLDKVTSLFIHMYPPVVLTVIRHTYKGAEERYPGLVGVKDYSWYTMILFAAIPYCIWQGAYYKFISVDRKSKIESGQRQNSFHYMLNDKRGPIGKALQGIRPEHRELWFIFGQLIYSLIFMVPPATVFINHARVANAFLVVIFTVSVWNGATFYVEVFGRKFERELERLRKEMEIASSTASSQRDLSSQNSPYVEPVTPITPGGLSLPDKDADADVASPLILPGTKENAADMEVPEMMLDRAADEVEEGRDQGRRKKKTA